VDLQEGIILSYDLNSIQEFIQQVAEAVAIVTKVDIVIIDANRNLVASSAGSRDPAGQEYYHHGSLTDRLFDEGGSDIFISREPGMAPECIGCKNYGTCHHLFVVAFPIRVNGKMLGSFCIAATTEQQRAVMLESESQVLQFLGKITVMIESVINERLMQNQLNVLLKRYNYVINSVHEGIIATDSDNNIVHMNRSASRLLELEEDRVLGKSILSLFPDLNISFADERPLETELDYKKTSKSRKKSFMATVVPILGENKEHMGVNISIRNLSEVQSYASRLMGSFSKYSFDDIQGNSLALKQIKESLRKAALTDSTILIRGESGTGKELFAHAVHTASYRVDKNFIALNCSAIPDSLLESELFGYEEGAFTGAKKGGKPGKFELARGGTIFLDEIGDMPLHLQSKLLRVLENRVIERVGGIEQIPIDVRIIAATNRNLEEMVENHEFRDDLYYRLSVIPVFIPPLRERKEDIPILIEHFLAKYSKHMGRSLQRIDPQVQKMLLHYSWPGNIRELQNTIEYAINMSEDGQMIGMEHLPNRLFRVGNTENKSLQINGGLFKGAIPNQPGKLKNMEIEAVCQALEKFGTTTEGKEQAAKYLGISIATLYRRLKEINSLKD
jgi:PAS domain S-box-containing protein